jgi:hypothetical protein
VSSRKSRHQLMQALLKGAPSYGTDPLLQAVDNELQELGRCVRLQPLTRQRLLQVLHASRAIDTCLRSILVAYGISPAFGIGKMLHQLRSLPPATRGYLSHAAAAAFVASIANPRNRYAHVAGSFPSSTREVDRIVSEVHACMAMIL